MEKFINKNLKALRKYSGLTQEQMGNIIGVKRSTYAHKETYGNFKFEEIQKFARHFLISTETLFSEDFDPAVALGKKLPPPPRKNNELDLTLTPEEINLIEMFRKLDLVRRREIAYEIMKG